jgi:hypothetical protein
LQQIWAVFCSRFWQILQQIWAVFCSRFFVTNSIFCRIFFVKNFCRSKICCCKMSTAARTLLLTEFYS